MRAVGRLLDRSETFRLNARIFPINAALITFCALFYATTGKVISL